MAAGNPTSEDGLPEVRFYALMAVLVLVEVLSSLEASMVVSVLPSLIREFGDITSAAWVVTAFALMGAVAAAVGGRLGDLFGRRRLLICVVVICGIGSLISAVSSDLGLVVLGRTLQGVSGAILPLCYGIVREVASPRRAPLWIGWMTGGFAFAAAAGYVLGGYLADTGSWRSVFWLTSGYALLLLPALFLFAPRDRPARGGRFDWLGALLFAPAIGAVLYGVTQSRSLGWGAPGAWGWVAGGFLVLAFWVRHELRHDAPLIDVRLLKRREVALGNLCGGLAALGIMQLPVISLLLMQQPMATGVGLGMTAAAAGLWKLPSNAGSLIASPLSGWISGLRDSRLAMIVGALVTAGAWLYLLAFHQSRFEVVFGTVLCAFGAAMLMVSIPNLVLEGAPQARSSEVTGFTSVVRYVFSAVGAQTIALLLATSHAADPVSGANFPSERAYELTFGYVALTCLVIVAACLAIRTRGARA